VIPGTWNCSALLARNHWTGGTFRRVCAGWVGLLDPAAPRFNSTPLDARCGGSALCRGRVHVGSLCPVRHPLRSVRGVDLGLGDSWRVPRPHGYTLTMIDTPDQAFVSAPSGTQLHYELTRIGATDRFVAVEHGGQFVLIDVRSGSESVLPTEPDLQAALSAAGESAIELLPPDDFYNEHRWGMADAVAGVLAFIPPGLAFLMFVTVYPFAAHQKGTSGMSDIRADRHKVQDVRRRIRVILNERWDPLGVAGDRQNEYDSYIDGIHALLMKHASDVAIARHLQGIEVGAMGTNGTPFEHLLRVAIELRHVEVPRDR
jgi:hypothetical protein